MFEKIKILPIINYDKYVIVSDLKTIENCHKKYNEMMVCIKYNNIIGLKKDGVCKKEINLWNNCIAKLTKD